jgi:polyisoprenoid-binding protein YceI
MENPMSRFSFARASCLMAGLLVSAPVLAQTVARDPAQVQAGAYVVEPGHTQIEFGVMHLGFTTFYGRFSGASGTLNLDPKKPDDSKLDIKIPVSSISTTSAKLDGELKGADWFNAAKFGDIVFHSTKVVVTGKTAKVTGDLTMHGVTKPVTLDVTFVGAGTNMIDKHYTVGFQARGELSRSAFGITTYVPMIGDAVQLTLSGAFEKQN